MATGTNTFRAGGASATLPIASTAFDTAGEEANLSGGAIDSGESTEAINVSSDEDEHVSFAVHNSL